MKREKAFVENRRRQVLKKIVESPGIRVDELAKCFHVSAVTIRRDLQALEDEKLLTRYYGGATPAADLSGELPEDDTEIYRSLIARYAASLVDDGDSLLINTSSTALQLLRFLNARNVTVITNNGRAINYEHPDGVSVILTGGELRYPKEAMVGEFAERNLSKVYAQKAFVGCSGISVECGVTTENVNEVNLNELMLTRATGESYILADHTKIGKNCSFQTCQIDQVTHLITDELASKEVLDAFRERGIDVHQVSKEKEISW